MTKETNNLPNLTRYEMSFRIVRRQVSELHYIIRDAAGLMLWVIIAACRLAILPFQLVILVADFVLAVAVLSVVALVLGLWLGMITPSYVMNVSANKLEHISEDAIATAQVFAKSHPHSVVGRIFYGPSARQKTGDAAPHDSGSSTQGGENDFRIVPGGA